MGGVVSGVSDLFEGGGKVSKGTGKAFDAGGDILYKILKRGF